MRGLLNGLNYFLISLGTTLVVGGALMAPQEAFADGYTTSGCTNITCSQKNDGEGGTYCSGECGGSTACGCNDVISQECNCNRRID